MSENNHHTILLLDDEPSVLKALRRDLQDLDAELITTTDVHEALQILKQRRISLIISDERMPRLSGWQFLSLARQIAPETIRVILTAHADIEAVGMAIQRARVAKLFLKPWNSDTFPGAICELLSDYKGSLNQEVSVESCDDDSENKPSDSTADSSETLDREQVQKT